jgi:ABC-2 type transport system ATP-binding protein
VAPVAALASRAQLLLPDEPTSPFDPIMEAAFTESIR